MEDSPSNFEMTRLNNGGVEETERDEFGAFRSNLAKSGGIFEAVNPPSLLDQSQQTNSIPNYSTTDNNNNDNNNNSLSNAIGFNDSTTELTNNPNISDFWKDISYKNIYLYWYAKPIFIDYKLSLWSPFYHILQWGISVAMWIFLVNVICIGIPFIILCCIGLLMLYIFGEFTILFTRLHVWFVQSIDYLSVDWIKPLRHRSVYNSGNGPYNTSGMYNSIPDYQTCCIPGQRMKRVKYVLFSFHSFMLVIFYLLVNPIVVWVTSIVSFTLVVAVGGSLVNPFLYAAHPGWYNKNELWWILLSFFIAIPATPIVLHISNTLAHWSKASTYALCTDDWFISDEAKQQGGIGGSNGSSGMAASQENHQAPLLSAAAPVGSPSGDDSSVPVASEV